MKYISVCSGIEAATVAWHPLGWEPLWFSEIEKFPSAVLAHHYPDIPNLGDMTKFKEWPDESVDLLVGGTPCQSFSIAGLRKGLDDPRGNLMLTYLAIAKRYRPDWLVWENVPGVLSSNEGRDFGAFLGALGELGYGWSYRVLDAQFFGIPQRRRRVFVVASLRGWQRAAAVLFERESLYRHPAPCREKGEKIAPTISARTKGGGGLGTDFELDGGLTVARMRGFGDYEIDENVSALKQRDHKDATDLVLEPMCFESRFVRNGRGAPDTVVPPLKAQSGETGKGDGAPLVFQSKASSTNSMNPGSVSPMLDAGKSDGVSVVLPIHDQATRFSGKRGDKSDGKGNGFGVGKDGDPCPTLTNGDKHAVAFAQNSRDEVRLQGGSGDVCGALSANEGMKQRTCIYDSGMVVRRLTPVECERLQGFPETIKSCTIQIWSTESQKNAALAEALNHRSQNAVGSAEKNQLQKTAKFAEMSLHVSHRKISKPVAVSVLLNLEAGILVVHSQEKLSFSVNIAEKESWCLLPIQAEDFAQLSVNLLTLLEKEAVTGKMESLLSIKNFSHLKSGNVSVNLCGLEIEELVNDVEIFTTKLNECLKFITSEVGQNSKNSERNLRTLLYCVTVVINSFIQEKIQPKNSYVLNLKISHGYTKIPYRNKPAEKCPDGPRYKAIGNSMAVPCMAWIGNRIQLVEDILNDRISEKDRSQGTG